MSKLNEKKVSKSLHWTTVASEKALLAVIGVLTLVAVAIDIVGLWEKKAIQLADLFLFFIYAEIIGMIGAFYASSRIPVTLPIIIAITALCRVLVAQGKEIDSLTLIAAAGAIFLLAGAAYLMSLKDKISLQKKMLRKQEEDSMNDPV
ncbi:MAG: phosphate-starvation-inducible E-like protein [Rhodospirillaceae bacterium TMED8]|nr:phosphate-starvation-inducible E-like protein [Magnetovibrio sp.]OUT51392.1 MAG: phosphate-starvation-inducible E-like protein [Rhodospirillaceae bacterium TMED8]|tara:strand:- start:127 stop:570 length:444 start_codon:yes stop_codon:yes gene_type:complete